MAKSYFFLFVLFILHPVRGHNDDCADSFRCGRHGPAIRFPFRLKDRHPDHCGFPGFNLSCSDTNDTLLELPISVKLFVKKIDYKSQEIHVYHPDRCFPRCIRQLNLSPSPFQFSADQYLDDFSFFNCSHTKGEELSYWSASCLDDPSYSYQVYALSTTYDDINELPTLPCRKMYSVRSIPYQLVYYPDDILYLNWSRPACGSMNTNSRSSTESEIQCFHKHNKGASIVGGRRSSVDTTSENASQVYFPEWIYNLLEQKEELRVFIEDDGDMKIAKKLAIVGLRCIQWHPMDRPSMKFVVQMLEGEGDKLIMPPNPFASPGPTRIHARKPITHLGQELDVIQELD